MKAEVLIVSKQKFLEKDFIVYGDYEKPLFLAKDIANLIEHSNVTSMINTVDDDEKVIIEPTKHSLVGDFQANTKYTFLTENGLYEVLMQSRKPIAKEFKKQIKKILHELRTKGEFKVPRSMKEALQIALEQQEKIEQQLLKIEQQSEQINQLEHALEYDKVAGWKPWNLLKKEIKYKGNFQKLVKEIPLIEEEDYSKKVMADDCYPTTLISLNGEEKLLIIKKRFSTRLFKEKLWEIYM